MKRSLNFLITILVIIILAYLFAPDPGEYRRKLKVVRGIEAAEAYRAAVAEYWQRTGRLPEAGELEKEGIMVKSNTDQDVVEAIRPGEDGPGTVSIYYSEAVVSDRAPERSDYRIVLSPEIGDGGLSWTCRGTLPAGSLPRVCRQVSGF